jgi:alpha-ketoglutarate-dependent 2,4-dichlorophenoxyacetate dioxygenase
MQRTAPAMPLGPALPRVAPLHRDFGVCVTGVAPGLLHADAFAEFLHELVDEHSLVLLPGQQLDDAAQLALSQRLGEPEPNPLVLALDGRIDPFVSIGARATRPGGDAAAAHLPYLAGGREWHSDAWFRPVPGSLSLVHARTVPPAAGERTAFASTRAAHARLPPATRQLIAPLRVLHHAPHVPPHAPPPPGSHAGWVAPVEHPLVRMHPRNGAASYFVGSHAQAIVGWRPEDGRRLLEELQAHATAHEHVHEHAWQPGDLMLWDSRCLLQRDLGDAAVTHDLQLRKTCVPSATRAASG